MTIAHSKTAPRPVKRFRADPELKKFVHGCIDRAERNMALERFHGSVLYHKFDKEGMEGTELTVAADVHVNRRYLGYTINVYPHVQKLWKDGEKDEVEKVIHHEMAHLATQHLFDLAISVYKDEGETKDAWESLTELLGRMSIAMMHLRAAAGKK